MHHDGIPRRERYVSPSLISSSSVSSSSRAITKSSHPFAFSHVHPSEAGGISSGRKMVDQ